MTTIPKPAALTSSFTAAYDAWNRMVSIVDGTNTVAVYQYDGLNRRTVKAIYASGSLDHNEHAYFNEGWQILEVRKEVSGTINSNPLEQYVWHPFYIDAPVLRDYDSATSGSPTRHYYIFDANYNVTAVTTSSGSPTERYYYSPYGNLTFLDGSFNVLATQASQIGNSVTYTGRQYDAESGLHYFRNRYLQSQDGVFGARDPIAYLGSRSSLYAYANDSPTNFVDPSGLLFVGGQTKGYCCARRAPFSPWCVCVDWEIDAGGGRCCRNGQMVWVGQFKGCVTVGYYWCTSKNMGMGFWKQAECRITPAGKRGGVGPVITGGTCPPPGCTGDVCVQCSVGYAASTLGFRFCLGVLGAGSGDYTFDWGYGIGTGTGCGAGGCATCTQ